jgi:hypothetical protein
MIMASSNNTAKDVAQAGEQLFRFAIDRGDMKAILDPLPVEGPEKRAALEYEIQLLRIVAVGWAIAFFLGDSDLKTPLGQRYWENMQTFSATLSTSATLTIGSDVDYFDILKQRLDYYVDALEAAGKIPQPAMAIGPAFADICGDRDDAGAILAGSKMFAHTIGAVREYLDESVLRWD